MSYSVSSIIHPHKDKNGLQKIQIMVIYKRAKVYIPTEFKVKPGSQSPKINAIVRKQIVDIEDKMIDALREELTVQKFKSLFKEQKQNSIYLKDFIETLCESKKGISLRTTRSLGNKVGSVKLPEITVDWLRGFERSMAHLDSNTINTVMKRLRSVLYRAAEKGFISESQFAKYKVPPYQQKLVEYLTEKEIEKLTKKVKSAVQGRRIAGWYFLLSCFTGWRISDIKRFDPGMVHDGKIVLRTKKNKEIVSIPIHSRLKEVLTFVSKNPFSISEQRARDFVKDLCANAGINKKVGFHTGRHSFAMLLMANGFTRDEVAELIGDSPVIAKVYARIHNESLDKKIRERLG